MYRLVPCIPIFRGFFIKSAKRMCICDYVKNHIGTFWNLCFDVKKGYKQIIVLDSPKTYCYQQSTLFLDITNCQSFKTKTSLKLEKLDNCRFDLRILIKILAGYLNCILAYVKKHHFLTSFRHMLLKLRIFPISKM